MTLLFGTKRPAITKHLNNIFKSKELEEKAVSSILEHTAEDKKAYKTRFYSLDAIISVGYRVNSNRATQFYETFDTHIDKDLTISLCQKGLSVKHRHQFAWFFAEDTESRFLYLYAFLTLAQDHSVEAALEILTDFKNANAIVEIENLSLQYFRTVVPPIETVIDCSVATGFEKVYSFTISRSWVVENLKKIDKLAAEFIRRACHNPEKDRLLIDDLIEKCPISEWKDKIQKAFKKEMTMAKAATSSNDTSRYRFSYCSAEERKENQSQTP